MFNGILTMVSQKSLLNDGQTRSGCQRASASLGVPGTSTILFLSTSARPPLLRNEPRRGRFRKITCVGSRLFLQDELEVNFSRTHWEAPGIDKSVWTTLIGSSNLILTLIPSTCHLRTVRSDTNRPIQQDPTYLFCTLFAAYKSPCVEPWTERKNKSKTRWDLRNGWWNRFRVLWFKFNTALHHHSGYTNFHNRNRTTHSCLRWSSLGWNIPTDPQ